MLLEIDIRKFPQLLKRSNLSNSSPTANNLPDVKIPKQEVKNQITSDIDSLSVNISENGDAAVLSDNTSAAAAQTNQEKNHFRERFGLLISATGYIAALLWFGGRVYATGYFSAMNLHLYMFNFSIWEYGEQYLWSLIILLSLLGRDILQQLFIFLGGVCIFTFIIVLIRKWRPELVAKNFLRVILKSFLGSLSWALVSGLLLVFLISIWFARDLGARNGLDYVTLKSNSVILYSKDPVIFETDIKMDKVADSGIFRTSGLRLLTYNAGKYYFYTKVDPYSCNPEKVYVVDDSKILSLDLSKGTPFDVPCAKLLKLPVNLTPVSTLPVPTATSQVSE